MANTAHTFPKYKSEYERLLKTMVIKPSWKPIVDSAAKKILANKVKYKEVEDATGVPWNVIGVIHWLECGGSFNGHLHNGDSLKKKTWQVPRGRPLTKGSNSDGSYTWVESAIDAVEYDGLTKNTDWSDARVAFLLEKYNGWGYRKPGINSPYLWSGSNHYTRGKYIADGKYDSGAISQQTGAVLLYRRIRDLEDPSPWVLPREERKDLPSKSVTYKVTNWFVLAGRAIAATIGGVFSLDFLGAAKEVTNTLKELAFGPWGILTFCLILLGFWIYSEWMKKKKEAQVAEGRHVLDVEDEDAVDTADRP